MSAACQRSGRLAELVVGCVFRNGVVSVGALGVRPSESGSPTFGARCLALGGCVVN